MSLCLSPRRARNRAAREAAHVHDDRAVSDVPANKEEERRIKRTVDWHVHQQVHLRGLYVPMLIVQFPMHLPAASEAAGSYFYKTSGAPYCAATDA